MAGLAAKNTAAIPENRNPKQRTRVEKHVIIVISFVGAG